MAASLGISALDALGERFARRTEAMNRSFVSEHWFGIQTARTNGHGFKTISKALFEDTGVRISDSVLQRHYRKLTKETALQTEASQKTEVVASTNESDTPFVVGVEYGILHHGNEQLKEEDGTYSGFFDGKYVFTVTRRDGSQRLRAISPAALKHYTVTRK